MERNKERKEGSETVLAFVFVLIIMTTLLFYAMRSTSVYPDKEEICKLEYGEKWKYEYTSDWGDTCIKKDYINLEIIDRKALTKEIIEKHCEVPSFFDITKWDNHCGDKE